MEFKKDSYYLVKDNVFKTEWCFKYNFHLETSYIDVYGYINDIFLDRFFTISRYKYKEICIDDAMIYFPNTDKYKISYLRKKRIKSLLNNDRNR